MADHSKIPYVDATIPLVVGCTPASSGCTHCWACRDAARMAGNPNPKISAVYTGLTDWKQHGPRWTGEVRMVSERIGWLRQWKKPRTILVSSHGDLFHDKVSGAFIEFALREMAYATQHTILLLTKRPERMASEVQRFIEQNPDLCPQNFLPHHIVAGISAEDQDWLSRRLPWLLKTRTRDRFISFEPLLGDVDLSKALVCCPSCGYPRPDRVTVAGKPCDGCAYCDSNPEVRGVSWVIAGCESGPERRSTPPGAFRRLRDTCQAAGVPYFLKQIDVGGKIVVTPKLDGQRYTMRLGDKW